jgi:excisionase family DNA binding protein
MPTFPRGFPFARRVLTTPEVAARYGVDPATVVQWVKRGYLQGVRLPGGRWRVFEDSCHWPGGASPR